MRAGDTILRMSITCFDESRDFAPVMRHAALPRESLLITMRDAQMPQCRA